MPGLVIEAGLSRKHYWADLWRYRELFYVLAWRDITVRYKQTAVGLAWAILQPLLTLGIFTLIFGVFAKMPSDHGAPYVIMVAAAQLPWQFVANSLTGSTQSLVGNAQLISKVYFPRLIIPAAAVVTALMDFLVSFVILIVLMVAFQWWPTWRLVALLPLVLLALLVSLGPGLLLTALTVKYRDFRVLLPFLIQIGAYISPVGFSSSVVPESWRLLYSLNPMVGVIEGFRWAVIGGTSEIYWPSIALSIGVTGILLFAGLRYFRKTERAFADMI